MIMNKAMQELIDWAISLQFNQQQCIDWMVIKDKAEQLLEKEAAKKYGREQPYQELFDYLVNELNVVALLTQMQEIEAIVMAKQKQINNEY